MNPDAMGEGRRWLRQAEQDLDDARYNLEGKDIPSGLFSFTAIGREGFEGIFVCKR